MIIAQLMLLTAGMATVGVQTSSIDKASADEDRLAAAISLAINENMSISYGVSTVDFETAHYQMKKVQVYLHLTQWVG